MSTSFDIVVAADSDDGIGRESELPWHLPGDLAFLKRVTTAVSEPNLRNAVVMGRKTFETIPPRFRPLNKRLNVVVTRNLAYDVPDGAVRASSVEEALARVAADASVERTFVLGGGEIYRVAIELPSCRRVLLTRVEGSFGCDTFFPEIPPAFELVLESPRHEENGVGYTFQTWERR